MDKQFVDWNHPNIRSNKNILEECKEACKCRLCISPMFKDLMEFWSWKNKQDNKDK